MKPYNMNTHTHTPGPWSVENCTNEDGSKFLSINGQGPWGSWLADIQAGNINGKPADIGPLHLANARLIAAAPDLLEIVKAYRNLLRTMASTEGELATFAHIESVLAKAEGNA